MSRATRSSSRIAGQVTKAKQPTPSSTPLLFRNAHAFSHWLSTETPSDGVFLQLSKKTNPSPTLTYDQALDVALAHGWIDGQRRSLPDAPHHFLQRFTPRRRGSTWSKRNVQIAERLIATDKMREQGLEEVRRAKEDGRWERAYEGSSAMVVPDDLMAAMEGNPEAVGVWEGMAKGERYVYLVRIETATDAKQRRQRIESCVKALTSDKAT